MTLDELIQRVRIEASDLVEPYFWSDEVITSWINDAVAEACVRGRLLMESDDPLVCEISTVEGVANYALHPSLYELTHLAYEDDGCAPRLLKLVSTEWLDAEVRDWRSREGRPEYAVQGDTTIRLVPKPNAVGVVRLEGYRLPIERMALEDKDTDEPEIHKAHHVHLIHWALHKGYSIPDAEMFDPSRSSLAEQEFTRYFGPRPDSDLRRITREDVKHHVEPFFI